MKKQSRIGLIVEGSATTSAVLRLIAKSAESLGPVKSASLRAARRLSNALRAGYPVEDYEGLQAAGLVFLRLPDGQVERTVAELRESELVMKDMSFVLCESWLTGGVLEPLAARGASTATLMSLPTAQRDWFAVEGSTRAVRQTRRWLDRSGARSDEVKVGSKDMLFASQLMATAVTMPLLITAQQALRASGFSGNVLSSLIEQMTLKTLQDLMRGARVTWGGPLNECSTEISEAHLRTLGLKNPEMSAFLHEQMALAKRVMGHAKSSPSGA